MRQLFLNSRQFHSCASKIRRKPDFFKYFVNNLSEYSGKSAISSNRYLLPSSSISISSGHPHQYWYPLTISSNVPKRSARISLPSLPLDPLNGYRFPKLNRTGPKEVFQSQCRFNPDHFFKLFVIDCRLNRSSTACSRRSTSFRNAGVARSLITEHHFLGDLLYTSWPFFSASARRVYTLLPLFGNVYRPSKSKNRSKNSGSSASFLESARVRGRFCSRSFEPPGALRMILSLPMKRVGSPAVNGR